MPWASAWAAAAAAAGRYCCLLWGYRGGGVVVAAQVTINHQLIADCDVVSSVEVQVKSVPVSAPVRLLEHKGCGRARG